MNRAKMFNVVEFEAFAESCAAVLANSYEGDGTFVVNCGIVMMVQSKLMA